MAAPKIRPPKSKLAPLSLVRKEMDEIAERLSQLFDLSKHDIFNALNTLLVADADVGEEKPQLLFMYSLEQLLGQASNKTLCLNFVNLQTPAGLLDLCQGLDAAKYFAPLSRSEFVVLVNGYRRLLNQDNDLAKHGYWNQNEDQLPVSFVQQGFHLLLPTRQRKEKTVTRSFLFDADSFSQEIEFVESHRNTLLEIRKNLLDEIADRTVQAEQLQVAFLADLLLTKFSLSELEFLFQTELKLAEMGNSRGLNSYSGGLNWLIDCYRDFYIYTSNDFQTLASTRTSHFKFDLEKLGIVTSLNIAEDHIITLVSNLECESFDELCNFLAAYGSFDFAKKAKAFEEKFFQLLQSKDPVTKFVDKAHQYGTSHQATYGDLPDFPRFEDVIHRNEIPKSFVASADFRTVTYSGETYTFTPNQAKVIGHLVEEFKKGLLEVNGEKIGDIVGFGEERIDKVFKVTSNGTRVPHPAWKKLIGPGKGRGNVRLLFRK
jgi:hypothetical protein